MLDLDYIRKNKDKVKKAIEVKDIKIDFEQFLALDEKRRALIQNYEDLKRRQNNFNQEVVNLGEKDREIAISDMKSVAEDLKSVQGELKEVESKWQALYYLIPNIPSDDSPIGGESDNKVVEKWGDIKKFDFKIKSHIDLGKDLDLIDFEKGVKVSGFRGYYLKNEAVLLHLAILNYSLNKIVSKGFSPMTTPVIVKDFALYGSGHFPFGQEDIYRLDNTGKDEVGKDIGEKLYLAGTSEPSLLAYFSDETLKEADLPVKVCGFSPCFRNEVGSYGKDAKGLYRIHEFMKIEQLVLCRADVEASEQLLQQMRLYSQEILEELNLPYRVLQIATKDMGAGKRKMYDIETWMPSREDYGETHSDSDLTDWQSRRLNIKYIDKDGNKKYVYALNNTVIASPRILIALLENNQQKDGSIKIPDPLVKYCGFKEIKRKNNGA